MNEEGRLIKFNLQFVITYLHLTKKMLELIVETPKEDQTKIFFDFSLCHR